MAAVYQQGIDTRNAPNRTYLSLPLKDVFFQPVNWIIKTQEIRPALP